MRYQKKAAIALLSILCFLLSVASTVLGEPDAQSNQSPRETQPVTENEQTHETYTGLRSTSGTTDDAASAQESVAQAKIAEPRVAIQLAVPSHQSEAQAPKEPMSSPAQAGVKNEKTTPGNTGVRQMSKKEPKAEEQTHGTSASKTAADNERKTEKTETPAATTRKQSAKSGGESVHKTGGHGESKSNPGLMSRIISATRGLVGRALSWLGTRYVWGGLSRKGVDCSGLTRLIYKSEGIDLPRTAKQQFKAGRPVPRKSLVPGDLVFFNTRGPITHVGMYIGNNKFIHAANPRRGVRIDSLGSAYYHKRFAGARRYIGVG